MQKDAKNLKNDRNPGKWVFIGENLARAIRWIPIWQGLNVFQQSCLFCAFDQSSLSIGILGYDIEKTYLKNPAWLCKLCGGHGGGGGGFHFDACSPHEPPPHFWLGACANSHCTCRHTRTDMYANNIYSSSRIDLNIPILNRGIAHAMKEASQWSFTPVFNGAHFTFAEFSIRKSCLHSG